tara:strand:- start:5168 stop:5404 length:237 start_codon:yes stop_codon:yes gene_type:complete
MINWIKGFFVTEEKTKKPKCNKCGLGASVMMLIEFQTLDMVEIEEKIFTRLCSQCHEEVHRTWNPTWIPEPIKVNKNE